MYINPQSGSLDYNKINTPAPQPCPHCGYCPTCHRPNNPNFQTNHPIYNAGSAQNSATFKQIDYTVNQEDMIKNRPQKWNDVSWDGPAFFSV